MAKFLKVVGIGCGGCLVLIIAVCLVGYSQLEDTLEIERSVVIDAPIEVVFPLVDSLHNWEQWDPWKKIDPDMTSSFEGPPAGVGAVHRWSSTNQAVGDGWIEIIESVPGDLVRLTTHMEDMVIDATFKFEETDNGIRVLWTNTAPLTGPMQRIFGAVADEYFLGPMFDQGLKQLKQIAQEKFGAISADTLETKAIEQLEKMEPKQLKEASPVEPKPTTEAKSIEQLKQEQADEMDGLIDDEQDG